MSETIIFIVNVAAHLAASWVMWFICIMLLGTFTAGDDSQGSIYLFAFFAIVGFIIATVFGVSWAITEPMWQP